MVGKRALEKEFTGLKKVDLCVNQRRKEQDRRKGGKMPPFWRQTDQNLMRTAEILLRSI